MFFASEEAGSRSADGCMEAVFDITFPILQVFKNEDKLAATEKLFGSKIKDRS
jgi:hypothetical protein